MVNERTFVDFQLLGLQFGLDLFRSHSARNLSEICRDVVCFLRDGIHVNKKEHGKQIDTDQIRKVFPLLEFGQFLGEELKVLPENIWVMVY